MLQLRVKAPFAAFRTFTAGWYRPTAPFLTPSAAYGLLLNIAAIESRRDDGAAPMTLTAENLPQVEVALGAVVIPTVQTIYQHLHNYPVGETRRERAGETKGNKYNIQPIRREYLSNVDAYICIRGDGAFERRVREGLRSGAAFAPEGKRRYGLPFLGDNNFIISTLREEEKSIPAYWLVRIERDIQEARSPLCRLTVWIDRQDLSTTRSDLYSYMVDATIDPPATPSAWTTVPPEFAS